MAAGGDGGPVSTPDPTWEVLWAPAKLTVSLRVTGVRDDGYHLLESEMVTLDLADTLEIAGPRTAPRAAGAAWRSSPTGRTGPGPGGTCRWVRRPTTW